jgi:hypothetical protein
MMTVTGAWGTGGNLYLGFHDPLSPESGRLDLYQVDGKRVFNYRYRGENKVFIDRAFAESVTQEWTATHPPQTAIQTGGGMVEAANLQDVWYVQMLKIGEAWYPTKQFHTFTGPECDRAEHWHANAHAAWGLNMRGLVSFDMTPERVKQRSAPLIEWEDPSGCGAGKVADVEVKNIMISREEAMALLGKIIQ